MPTATGIGDNHGNVAQISSVANRGLNSDLHGYSDNGEGFDAAVAQRHIERRSFKRGHCDFVEDRLARQWIQLGNELKAGRIAQEPRPNLLNRLHPLPGHRGA